MDISKLAIDNWERDLGIAIGVYLKVSIFGKRNKILIYN